MNEWKNWSPFNFWQNHCEKTPGHFHNWDQRDFHKIWNKNKLTVRKHKTHKEIIHHEQRSADKMRRRIRAPKNLGSSIKLTRTIGEATLKAFTGKTLSKRHQYWSEHTVWFHLYKVQKRAKLKNLAWQCMPIIPALERLRQEDLEFEESLH